MKYNASADHDDDRPITSWETYEQHPIRFTSSEECLSLFASSSADHYRSPRIDGEEGVANHSHATPIVSCNATWDRVLCWPASPINATVKLPCPPWFLGLDSTKFSYRTCGLNGRWAGDPSGQYSQRDNESTEGWTNYLACYPDWIKNDLAAIKTISFGARILETIGLALSLIALIVSLGVFFHFKNIRCDRIRIHRNLFVAMTVHVVILLVKNVDQLVALTHGGKMAGDIKSMVASGKFESSIDSISVMCQLLVCGVEYTKTVVFAWMFIEGLFLHSKLIVSVFTFKPNYCLYYVIGWGLPLLVTSAWALIFTFKSENKCWFAYTHKAYFWILEVPRISVIAVNLIFLLNILRVVITKLRESNTAENEQIRKAVKAAIVLLPLLGANHLLAITGPPGYSPTTYGLWAFTSFLLTAFQGLIIALLYCFLNAEVRYAVEQHWQRRKLSQTLSLRLNSTSTASRRSLLESRKRSSQPTVLAGNRSDICPITTVPKDEELVVDIEMKTGLSLAVNVEDSDETKTVEANTE